ncbi:MAG: ABC transporter permease [Solirubrobacteraceae bacterium]
MSVAVRPTGKPIVGPRALSDDPRRFWNLTFTIAKNDFKLKFFGSALGYVWQLMRPLMLFGVLAIVFTQVFPQGKSVKNFPQFLLGDIVLFTFFAEATAGSVRSVLDRENLVRKIEFPRMVIPLSIVLTSFFNLCLNMIAVTVLIVAIGAQPHWTWLEVPVLLLVLMVLSTGVAMLLSSLFVRFRDIAPIWDVLSQMLFYGSPIIYATDTIFKKFHHINHYYMANPLAVVMQQFRHAVVDPSAQNAAQAAGGWVWLLPSATIVLGSLVLGFVVFNRSAPRIAEYL